MEIVQSLEQAIKHAEKFLLQLLNTAYPFAMWRSPLAEKAYLMIDLSAQDQKHSNSEDWSIENESECFLVNAYNDSHPPRPRKIAGDIIVIFTNSQPELKINPKISSTKIENFLETIDRTVPFEFNKESDELKASQAYEEHVEKALKSIETGLLQKVVLSRYQDFDIPSNFSPYNFFEQINSRYPNAFCYILSTPENGVWMGATPERLMTIENGRQFTTDALAGTQPIEPDTNLAHIAWTQKEIEEQAMVSRYIIDCFKKIRLREFDEVGPKTVRAGNLAHLKTSFVVDMEATNSPNLGNVMLDLLHPTSAICGFPREEAHQFINETENFDRELFCGFIGPVNYENATRLFVNLRCMKLVGNKARLYAGAGITADSIPSKELEETNSKMKTLLSALQAE